MFYRYFQALLINNLVTNASDWLTLTEFPAGIRLVVILVIFSSPEPKAQVSYCHSAPSVVRLSSSGVNFHIFDFFSRTTSWILMKLGMHEVLMVPYKCCCFSAISSQGWIQGGAKKGHGGFPSSRNFFFRPEGYRDKPNA